MKVVPIKTDKIVAGKVSIYGLLVKSLPVLSERSIVAITSKVLSLCENRVIPTGSIDKDQLLTQESDLYLPGELSKYGHHFTITRNTLIPMAGIDESNGNGQYILWPTDSQKSANDIREFLVKYFKLKGVGVVITDSTCQPLRRGTTGIVLGWSGFAGLRNYIGKPDLFGRPFAVTSASIAGGLAATAVLVMGEGTEQTPLCVLSDLPFVEFQSQNPSKAEIAEMNIPPKDDLFAPFLSAVHWRKGKGGVK